MEDILKDLHASIEKNLPAQVGDVLKKKLEQADFDAVRVKAQEGTINEKTARISDLEARIYEYQKNDQRNAALDDREKSLNEKERQLRIKELEAQLANEKEKTEFVKSISLGLVRNIEYRKNVFDSVTTPTKDQYGGISYDTKTSSSDETKTAD